MINAINDLQKLTEALHNLAFDLMLEENPEFKEYFDKSDVTNFTVKEEDFYVCKNPLVRQIFDLSASLEFVKDEFVNLIPTMKETKNLESDNRKIRDSFFEIFLSDNSKIHIIARDFKDAILKAEKQLGNDEVFPSSFLTKNQDLMSTTLQIKNVVLLTKEIII